MFFGALFILTLASCKKCATCTYKAQGSDSTLTSEFCNTGRIYQNQLDQHELSGWKCTE
jgi:hypothetical protein